MGLAAPGGADGHSVRVGTVGAGRTVAIAVLRASVAAPSGATNLGAIGGMAVVAVRAYTGAVAMAGHFIGSESVIYLAACSPVVRPVSAVDKSIPQVRRAVRSIA